MEDRRQKTLLQKKNAMLLRMEKKEQEFAEYGKVGLRQSS